MFFSEKMMKFFFAALVGLGVLAVHAATQTINVGIRFLAPINLANTINPSFGAFEVGAIGRNFVLGVDGTISGVDATAYIGGASAGSVVLHGSEFHNVDIVAQNLINNGGVNIATVSCSYGGSGAADCLSGISAAAAPGIAGTTLLLGLGVNTTVVHADGSVAAPAFDIVVTYN